jgi:hypothetical protein
MMNLEKIKEEVIGTYTILETETPCSPPITLLEVTTHVVNNLGDESLLEYLQANHYFMHKTFHSDRSANSTLSDTIRDCIVKEITVRAREFLLSPIDRDKIINSERALA